MDKKRDTSWGGVAAWYDDYLASPDSYQQQVVLPNLLRLVAPCPGERILDLACGQGFFSKELVQAGAVVTGVDVASELIALAIKHVPNATFLVAPSDKLPLADKSFDQVVCVLAIQNIRLVRETLAEVARVLAPSGRLHVVLNHPAFRVPQASAWGWDEVGKTQYRRVDGYLSEREVAIQMHPGSHPSRETLTFHRPLQWYVKLLAAAGFAVVRLEEWISHKHSQPGPRQTAEDRARREFPLFLYLQSSLRSVYQDSRMGA